MVRREQGSYPLSYRLLELKQEGERLPYFRRYIMGLLPDYNKFMVRDRQKLTEPRYEGEFNADLDGLKVPALLREARSDDTTPDPSLHCANLGHLVILPLGHKVFAFDPVGKRLLWQHNLFGPGGQPPITKVVVDPHDGGLRITYAYGWVQRQGRPGLVSPDAVVLQTPGGLTALNPLSGECLWSRSGLPRRADVFGDGQHVFVVGLDGKGKPQTSQVLRVADGTSLRVPAFAALYRERQQLFRGTLVLADTGDKGEMVLRHYDLLTGKDLWSKKFLPNSLVTESANDLAGVVEPDGTVTVVELSQHKPVLTAKLRPGHLDKVRSVRLVRDAHSCYLICERTADHNNVGPVLPHLREGRGFRTVPVNGVLWRFNLSDPDLSWYNEVTNQVLLLNRFEESPVVLLAARYQREDPFHRRLNVNVAATRIYDKTTGKLIFDEEDTNKSLAPYHTLRVDPVKGVIELVSDEKKVVLDVRQARPK